MIEKLFRSPLFEEAGAADGGGASGDTASTSADATPPANPYEGVFNAEGDFSEGWGERLPEGYREFAKTTGQPKNLPELVKSYAHLRGKLGQNTVVPPSENSTPEELAAFREAMGVPSEAAAYGLTDAPDNLPDGIGWDSELGGKVAEWAHANNVPPAAVQALVGLQMEHQQGAFEGLQAQMASEAKANDDALREAWGAQYKGNQETVDTLVTRMGADMDSEAFAHPEVRKVLAKLGTRLAEGDLAGVETTGASPLGPTAQAEDIMTNPANPLYQAYQRGDQAALDKVNALFQQSV